MVNFGKFSSENTAIFDDFSPKMTKVCPKYVSWGCNQDGVAITRIRYVVMFGNFCFTDSDWLWTNFSLFLKYLIRKVNINCFSPPALIDSCHP